jgi:hypothetical protein
MRYAAGISLGLGLLVSAGGAASPPEEKPAVLHFADLGGIRDFRAVGDALFVQGTNRRWFRATFFGRCLHLRNAEAIGFVTEPGGSLDRFSSILVDGERCVFRSFERAEPPARREPKAATP